MLMLSLRWFLAINSFLPHGDLDQRILEISLQIQAYPDSMELRVRRGELYIQHEEYESAKADFVNCYRNGIADTRTLLGLSHSYLFAGPVDSSLYFLNIVLSNEPGHFSALELKSVALDRMGKYCESATTVQKLISAADHPTPLLYIRAASAWKSCDEEGNIEKAILILKDGITKIPQNRVLKDHLITIYKHADRFEEALEVQSSIVAQSSFKSRSLFNRAKLYLELSLIEPAQVDLKSALMDWESLPEHKKAVPAMVELRREIVALLVELKN